MTEKVFNKIAEGLNEALSVSRQDPTEWKRSGRKKYAELPENSPIEKLEIRRGRLVAVTKSGMHHIIPEPKSEEE